MRKKTTTRLSFCVLLTLGAVVCLPLYAGSGRGVGKLIEIASAVHPGESFENIRHLGAISLSGSDKLAELSDLAWDADDQLLYAISDQGRLLSLTLQFQEQRLTGAKLISSHRLRGLTGKKLKGKKSDAEGLNIRHGKNGIPGDAELLVSFERNHRVRVLDLNGRETRPIPLPPPLDNPEAYDGKNNGIEGFVEHPALGLLFAPEIPLRGDENIRLVSERGDHWFLPTLEPGGGVVAMENTLKGILVMERAVTSLIHPWTITLYEVTPTKDNRNTLLQPRILARMNSGEGWYLQNMEGLARLDDHRYLMVSDDGGSFWQQTQLVMFEIFEQPAMDDKSK